MVLFTVVACYNARCLLIVIGIRTVKIILVVRPFVIWVRAAVRWHLGPMDPMDPNSQNYLSQNHYDLCVSIVNFYVLFITDSRCPSEQITFVIVITFACACVFMLQANFRS